jgi:aerobic carbon-monoxide dehydrogenase large subunit
MISPGEFPYIGVTGIRYDEGSYLESLDTAEKWVSEHSWAAEIAGLTEKGVLAGIGYACFSERTGYGTPVMSQRRMSMTPGFDTAIVRMDPTGNVQVMTGTCSHGQGHETTFAQIVADKLSLHPNQVSIRQGDTDLTPYGWGTFASRSVVIGGGAAARAAEAVATRLRKIAAYLLDTDASNIEVRDGVAHVSVDKEAEISITEIARIAYFQSHLLPADLRYGLAAEVSFDPPGTFSNACHAAFVVIDPETGKVRVHRYLVVEDCGVMINPRIVAGQILGGVAQGLGAALYESIQYSMDGQPLTGSFTDYLVPTASEMCPVDIVHLETPSQFSESGAKGMGEGGMIGAPAAILNAINNALGEDVTELDHIPVSSADVAGVLACGGSCSWDQETWLASRVSHPWRSRRECCSLEDET